LVTISKLLAPAMPFVSEALYRNLVADMDQDAPDSVHLTMWPEADEAVIQQQMIDEMCVAMKLVRLGRAARETVQIGIRQPLAKAQFVTRENTEAVAVTNLGDLIKDELNVKAVEVLDGAGSVVQYALNPIPAQLGRKFGKNFPRVQKVLREGDPADVERYAKQLMNGETITIDLDGETFEVTPEECEVKQGAAEGYALVEENGYLAALDTTLTDDLVAEGLAREIVRRIQQMRKDADFEIEDRIDVVYTASDRLTSAIQQFAEYIQTETLAESMAAGDTQNGFYGETFDAVEGADETSIKSETFTLGVKQISA
jgi:isoleucyl-tRNA synthetase